MKRLHIIEASKALANMSVFDGIVGLLESGSVYGYSKAAGQIICICKKEIQRQLIKHDAAIDAALAHKGAQGDKK